LGVPQIGYGSSNWVSTTSQPAVPSTPVTGSGGGPALGWFQDVFVGGTAKPAQAPSRASQVGNALAAADATQDPVQMNRGDFFRSSLKPKERQAYDEALAQLREDPRIEFQFEGGAKDSTGLRELALRGMLAASFGQPEDLRAAIRTAANASADGRFDISILGSDPRADAVATANGLEVGQQYLRDSAARGNNPFVYTFSQHLQGLSNDPAGRPEAGDFPPDMSEEHAAAFEAAFDSPPVQKLLGSTGLPNQFGPDAFPTIQGLFRQQPLALKSVSPDLYDVMTEWSGLDPAKGELTSEGWRRAGPSILSKVKGFILNLSPSGGRRRG
jgi:hypothetical protein